MNRTSGVRCGEKFGAGLGYRSELSQAIAAHREELDVIEITADQWLGDDALSRLHEVVCDFPTVAHGVGMSVAGAGMIPEDYLSEIRKITRACEAPYYSEHLAMTHVPGLDSGHLCPPVISEQSLRTCVRNIEQAQSVLGIPLALENITYTVAMADDHLAAADFFADVVTAAESFILLDVANLYINAQNHSFDPLEYLGRLPMDRVVHIHLAGGVVTETGKHIDSHSELIGDGIWQLAREASRRCTPKTVIVEHDQEFPDIEDLLREVNLSRKIFFSPG
ncbi:DUF692 family multinuclear iron-containing protein [Streptomyces sp. NPDC057375]|uniref:DUF692 domain-containing protein n=1 Tax=Streptomyces sp. NPDC057375 TaxID=3346109 RepID=UPI00362B9A26